MKGTWGDDSRIGRLERRVESVLDAREALKAWDH
jgi:hypothetical protein